MVAKGTLLLLSQKLYLFELIFFPVLIISRTFEI